MRQLSLEERFEILHNTFTYLQHYFAHWNYIPKGTTLETLQRKYTKKLLSASDREAFGMLMDQMIAELKNGHTWYVDSYIYDKKHGLGFYAFYHDKEKKWIVSRSAINKIHIGDTIRSINHQSTEAFFKKNRKYLHASSERAERNALFAYFNLFGERFSVTTENGTFIINRKSLPAQKQKTTKTTGRAISPGIYYVKIPSLYKKEFAGDAVRMIRQHKDCKNLIIDLRGNGGGNTPRNLIRMLIKRPAKGSLQLEVRQKTASQILTAFYSKKGNTGAEYKSYVVKYKPMKDNYKGRLFVLVNPNTPSILSLMNASSLVDSMTEISFLLLSSLSDLTMPSRTNGTASSNSFS